MGFTIDGNTPSEITYNGNDVTVVTYNGEVIWSKTVSIVYSGACDGGNVNTHRYVTLSPTSSPSNVGAGTYTYKIRIPYQKTTSATFTTQCYLCPVLQDANGNTIKDFGENLLNGTSGTTVRYLTLSWTSTTWYGNADSYTLYINSSGGNKTKVKYPSGYDMTFTCSN